MDVGVGVSASYRGERYRAGLACLGAPWYPNLQRQGYMSPVGWELLKFAKWWVNGVVIASKNRYWFFKG